MANIGTLFYLLWFLSFSLHPAGPIDRPEPTILNEFSSGTDTSPGLEFNSESTPIIPEPLTRIMIDAGHGGHDHGCSGTVSNEKEITLAIALKLEQELKQRYPDIEVLQTRTTDAFVPLHERIRQANRQKADVFLSIHANSFGDGSVSGTEVFVMGLHTAAENLRVAQRENASVLLENDFLQNYDGFDPNSPEGQIILSMFQNVYLEKSISLADKISDQISSTTGFSNRGVKQAGFVILRKAAMPSVLIETGFLTHHGNEQVLNSASGQMQVARAISDALGAYKEELEKEYDQIARLREKTKSLVPDGSGTHGSASVFYRVQLAAFTGEAPNSLPDVIAGEPIEIIYESGMKKILAGKFSSLEEATELRDRLRDAGAYDKAFVTAYIGEDRLDLNKALSLKQSH